MLLLPTLLLYALGLLLTGIGSRLASRCATWCGALCGLPMWMVGGTLVAVCTALPQLVLAFLDIGPINFGHTLVIPKEHHTSTATIPEATCGRMFHVGARIGVAVKRALDADAFNLHLADGTCAGQVVMHAHLHVVPRSTDDSFHWNWRQLKYESDAVRDEIAEKMRRALKLNPDE